jgi:hypothetical protein
MSRILLTILLLSRDFRQWHAVESLGVYKPLSDQGFLYESCKSTMYIFCPVLLLSIDPNHLFCCVDTSSAQKGLCQFGNVM